MEIGTHETTQNKSPPRSGCKAKESALKCESRKMAIDN